MTISQTPSDPLFVVVGATGTQGGSVVRAITASDKAYRVRGLTRDPTSAASQALTQQGVAMVRLDSDPVTKNPEDVDRAFEGATYAFVSLPSTAGQS